MPGRSSARILVVDDDKEVTDSVGAYLERVSYLDDERYHYTYDVVLAYTGWEAIKKVELFAPHLLVLDWYLPTMNGQQVCQELHRRGYELPIIMLTQRAEPDIQTTMLACDGVDDYVTKPYLKEVLEARIQSVLNRTHPDCMRLPCLISADQQVYLDPNPDTREARLGGPQGTPLPIRDERFVLLYTLMLEAQQPIPTKNLLRKVWRGGGNNEALTQAIYILRRELSVPNAGEYIEYCNAAYRFAQSVRVCPCRNRRS